MARVRTYGLIGKSLTHSFSPDYFLRKFEQEGLSFCTYELFPLPEIQDFLALIKAKDLAGLNVTIPYKQAIIPYLDKLNEEALAISAVNCIAFEKGGKLKGYNTDVIGFENSLKPLLNEKHKRHALVLGTGGASQAVVYVLNKLEIPYTLVSRNSKNTKAISYVDAEKQLAAFSLIINTTPVGTYPNMDEMPFQQLQGIGEEHLVYDLIYNPKETSLLRQAAARGALTKNGLEMLEIQAEESWKIWQRT